MVSSIESLGHFRETLPDVTIRIGARKNNHENSFHYRILI
jgi:hypothetical protein